jgi:hypothetical protein
MSKLLHSVLPTPLPFFAAVSFRRERPGAVNQAGRVNYILNFRREYPRKPIGK